MQWEWRKEKLGNVAELVSGGTPKTDIKGYWNGDILWITPKDIGSSTDIYVDDTSRKISSAGLEKSSAKLVPENSVILSTRAPIGNLAINRYPMAFNQGCRGLVPSERLDTKFLFYFLKLNKQLLNDLGKGTTFKELPRNALANILIPLPSLSEQKRIVAILDEAFAGIDAVIAKTQKNVANARELFESYLGRIFAQRGDGWSKRKLGEVCLVIAGQSPSGRNYNDNGDGLPFYQGKRNFGPKYIGPPTTWTSQITKEAEGGDILMSVRAPVGPINFATGRICIGRGIAAIRHGDEVDRDFLFYSLLYKQPEINGNDGAVFASINKEQIENIELHIPPLSEQKRIVADLDRLGAETQRLEAIYRRKLDALTELKQSILHKAFRGGLTEGRTR